MGIERSGLSVAAGILLSASLTVSAAPPDARLADAMMRAERDTVEILLRQKADLNAAQADGMTALHWAARQGDLDMVRTLLKAGAKPDIATRYGVTPFYIASQNSNTAMIDAFLRAGVNPNTANPGGETALMTVARTGNVAALELLIARGADVNAKEKVRGQTALMWAALENHPDAVRLLIAKGADPNAQTAVDVPEGTNGEPQGTSADTGAHGPGIYRPRAIPAPSGAMTPLLFAAREGHLDVARVLLDAKAEIDRPSANGSTPLVVATTNNHIQLAMFLLDRGASANQADRFWKRTPLFAAVEMRNRDFPPDAPPPVSDPGDPMDLIKALLKKGADPNAQVNTTPVRGFMQRAASWTNFDGQTAFIRAALAGDVSLMRLLLEYGADPNIKTNEGSTALMAAAGINWVFSQTYTRTNEEYLEAAKLCLERGNDVNAVNKVGFRAIHGAANKGFDAMVRLLASAGAKLDVKDAEGRTPMTFAEGVFLAIHPPKAKPTTVALLKELMGETK